MARAASNAPTAQAVVYYGKDLDTKGDWIGKYGAGGYILCDFDAGKGNNSMPWQEDYDRKSSPPTFPTTQFSALWER